jgi:hypothetical protein
MKTLRAGLIAWLAVPAAFAQAPVEDAVGREQAIQRGQRQAGTAYQELQQARYDVKVAEQEYLNAAEAQRAAQQQASAAKQALDAARTREAEAAKRYDEALHAVDRAFRQPPPK